MSNVLGKKCFSNGFCHKCHNILIEAASSLRRLQFRRVPGRSENLQAAHVALVPAAVPAVVYVEVLSGGQAAPVQALEGRIGRIELIRDRVKDNLVSYWK